MQQRAQLYITVLSPSFSYMCGFPQRLHQINQSIVVAFSKLYIRSSFNQVKRCCNDEHDDKNGRGVRFLSSVTILLEIRRCSNSTNGFHRFVQIMKRMRKFIDKKDPCDGKFSYIRNVLRLRIPLYLLPIRQIQLPTTYTYPQIGRLYLQ